MRPGGRAETLDVLVLAHDNVLLQVRVHRVEGLCLDDAATGRGQHLREVAIQLVHAHHVVSAAVTLLLMALLQLEAFDEALGKVQHRRGAEDLHVEVLDTCVRVRGCGRNRDDFDALVCIRLHDKQVL